MAPGVLLDDTSSGRSNGSYTKRVNGRTQPPYETHIVEQPVTEQRPLYVPQAGDGLIDPGTARVNYAPSRESPQGSVEWAKTRRHKSARCHLPRPETASVLTCISAGGSATRRVLRPRPRRHHLAPGHLQWLPRLGLVHSPLLPHRRHHPRGHVLPYRSRHPPRPFPPALRRPSVQDPARLGHNDVRYGGPVRAAELREYLHQVRQGEQRRTDLGRRAGDVQGAADGV